MKPKHILVVGAAVAALAMPALAAEGGSMSDAMSGAMDDGAMNSGMGGGGGRGGAAVSTFDLQHQLSEKGYTEIKAVGGPGTTRFRATNPDGKKVEITVNANTGDVIDEKPLE